MILVLFGQPGSGKSTLANKLQADYYIDGDRLRKMYNNYDYSREGRIRNLNTSSDISTFMHYMHHSNIILSIVHPYEECREYLNKLVPDVKWVYLTYEDDRGKENYFVKDFEIPNKDRILHLNTSLMLVDECINSIVEYVYDTDKKAYS